MWSTKVNLGLIKPALIDPSFFWAQFQPNYWIEISLHVPNIVTLVSVVNSADSKRNYELTYSFVFKY